MKSFIYSISIINKMQSDILKITDIPLVDETIERYEFHEYEPTARTNLNTAGEIRINIDLQDLFSYPSESYLQFEGRLTKTYNTAYVNADAVARSRTFGRRRLGAAVWAPAFGRRRLGARPFGRRTFGRRPLCERK